MLPFWFFHPFTGDENKDIPEKVQGALNRCWLNICGMLRSWLQHHVMKGNAEVRVSHGIFGWLLPMSVPLWCGGQFKLLFRECLGDLCGVWMNTLSGVCTAPFHQQPPWAEGENQFCQPAWQIWSSYYLRIQTLEYKWLCVISGMGVMGGIGDVCRRGTEMSYLGTETPFHVILQNVYVTCGTVRAL